MQTIYLDISNKGVIPCIQAKQSEVGRKFLAVITDNGVPYNIPTDSLLSVWYEGDTDAGNYSSIEEKSAFVIDGNKVTVELVAQMLLKPGNGELCLSVTHGDGGETNTWNIPYCVEYKPGAGSAVPTEYYTALTEAGAAAAKAATDAFAAAEKAQEAVEGYVKIAEIENYLLEYEQKKVPVGYTFHWYPVDGSGIDLSTPQKVHEHFGFGVWEQIKDKFLLACGENYVVGEVGGSETHTITIEQMPAHTHDGITAHADAEYLMTYQNGVAPSQGTAAYWSIQKADSVTQPLARTIEAGSGEEFNIMPPYFAVYTWMRIS